MNVVDAIYGRRSIRRFKSDEVTKETIEKLLEAATLAPSSSNAQPWAFVVIQDRDLLKNYSDRAKSLLLSAKKGKEDPYGYKSILSKPDFNIFYNAETLIAIYAESDEIKAFGDCSIAAQNLMLAAHANKLGTCWIGFATPLFDTAEFKEEIDIPTSYKAVAPLILGYPEVIPANYSRKPPKVLVWK